MMFFCPAGQRLPGLRQSHPVRMNPVPRPMASVETPPSSPGGGKKLDLRGELSSLKIDRTKARKPSLLSRMVLFVLVLAVLAGIGVGAYWALKDRLFPLPVVNVESARVMTKGQVSAQLTATGYLESRWQAAVGAKVPGRIASIPVEEGDKVRTGDVLAELEHSDLDASLASRKVAVTLAEAQISEAEYTLAQNERNMNRQRQLLERNAGTLEGVEQAETAFQVSQATLAAREAALESAKASVTEAEEAIKNMFIYAPFDGTVVTKDAEQGESIMPGGMGASSGRGSVITLAKLDELEVDTDVKEDYLGQLRKGQPTQVLVDAVPNHRYKGKLREIIPMGDRTRGIVKVKVQIIDPDERLFPELSATVLFLPDAAETYQPEEKSVFIPATAIQDSEGNKFVWVATIAEGQGTVRKVEVTTTGEPNEGLVEIKSGLSGGEQVVVNPPPGLKDGEQIKLAE
jgi:RND family efflux transporter MFP subunit